jgi:hypothetical protein
MKVKDTFLVTINFELGINIPDKYLVEGIGALSKLLNLLSTSERYSLVSVEKIGEVKNTDELIEDLIDEQKPDGLDCSCKFV